MGSIFSGLRFLSKTTSPSTLKPIAVLASTDMKSGPDARDAMASMTCESAGWFEAVTFKTGDKAYSKSKSFGSCPKNLFQEMQFQANPFESFST